MIQRLSNTILWQYAEVVPEFVTSIGAQGIVYCALVLVIMIAWYFAYQPANIVKDLSGRGYGHLKGKASRWKKEGILRKRTTDKSIGDIPPVYPNGWFVLVESRDLKVGETKPVAALGHEFAVFRGSDKKAYVVDAFCPHLGAHLGVGGKVSGSCIECPFHGWKFRGKDGACVHVPYSDKVPEFSKLKVWTSCEVNGCIFVWHHAENEPPQWQVPEVTEITTGQWQYKGRTEHIVNCHIQEIPENGADVAHLNHIHSAAVTTGGDLRNNDSKIWNGLKHIWAPTWEVDSPSNEHVTKITLQQTMSFYGLEIPFFWIDLYINQIGPALVHLRLSSVFGKGIFVQYVTPEGPMKQKVVHQMYAERTYTNIISRLFFLKCEATMLERDIMVWNNKKYLNKPTLMKEDRFVLRYRRWYSQFYSENSPTLKSIRKKSLHW